MRLAGQEKLGFYPAPNAEMEAIAKHLTLEVAPTPREQVSILDPCAGQGAAVQALSEALGIPQQNVYCIELDAERGTSVVAAMPKAHVLHPCSFMSAGIDGRSFGLVYANPPFDDELGGGGRDELAFLREIDWLLCSSGVLVFVAPWKTMVSRGTSEHLASHYDGRLWRFTDCKFKECVFIGTKRSTALASNEFWSKSWLFSEYKITDRRWRDCDYMHLPRIGNTSAWDLNTWKVPACWAPRRFVKRCYTEPEMKAAVAGSPLNRLATSTRKPKPKRPPMPLGVGHLALTIASGLLDGLVTMDGWEPHVMKGVETKEKYLTENLTETKLSPDGKHVIVKEVYSEQAITKIHAVDGRGRHFTWQVTAPKTVVTPVRKCTEPGQSKQDEAYAETRRIEVTDYERIVNLMEQVASPATTDDQKVELKKTLVEIRAKYRKESA